MATSVTARGEAPVTDPTALEFDVFTYFSEHARARTSATSTASARRITVETKRRRESPRSPSELTLRGAGSLAGAEVSAMAALGSHAARALGLGVDDAPLRSLLRAVEAAYRDVPYHNALHGAGVGQAVACLMLETRLRERLTRAEQLALLVAAFGHDVAHPGLTSAFLKASKAPVAALHADPVLESMHAARLLELADAPENDVARSLGGGDAERRAFRECVVFLVLGTDMGAHAGITEELARRRPGTLARAALHLADLSGSVTTVALSRRWVARLREETLAQGDAAVRLGLRAGDYGGQDRADPRPQSTAGFARGVVLPLLRALSVHVSGLESRLRALDVVAAAWEETERGEAPPATRL